MGILLVRSRSAKWLTIFLPFGVALGALALTGAPNPFGASGEDPKVAAFAALPPQSQGADTVVATVNRTSISLLTLKGNLVLARHQDASTTPDAVIDGLIDYELLYQEGVRRGLVPTDNEISAAIGTSRAGVADSDVQLVIDYAKASGRALTVEQYWTDPGLRDGFRRSITAGRVHKAMEGDDPGTARASFERGLASLRQKAEIHKDASVLELAR